MALVQRVYLDSKRFGAFTVKGAVASDSQGVCGGKFWIYGPGANWVRTAVQFDFTPLDEEAHGKIVLDNGDVIECAGTYNADAVTERILNPIITALSIGGKQIVPPTE